MQRLLLLGVPFLALTCASLAGVRSHLASRPTIGAPRQDAGGLKSGDRTGYGPAIRLGTGMGFVEGPVWIAAEKRLVFSDIPGGRMMQWNAEDGVSVWCEAPGPNGNALGPNGELLSCLHGLRAVVRFDRDGAHETVAARWNGKRLNSPNDLAVQRDGTIWLTDPPWGLEKQRVGREIDGNFVYRVDGATGAVEVVITDRTMPNGIALAPDESRLYVSDTGGHASHPDAARHGLPAVVSAYALVNDKEGRRVLDGNGPIWRAETRSDGMCVHPDGRLFATGVDGVTVWTADGAFLFEIPVPETPSNVCLGGTGGNTLLITARSSLYGVELR